MAHGHNPTLAGLSGKVGEYVVYQLYGQTVLRTRPRKRVGNSKAQLDRQTLTGKIGATWHSVPADAQERWRLLGLRMPDWDNTRAGQPLSPYVCFLSVNTGRDALKLPFLLEPPAAPDLPPFLGGVTVAARLTGDPASPFSLGWDCGGFHGAGQVFASRPVLPSQEVTDPDQFRLLTVVPDLGADGVDLGSEFTQKRKLPRRDEKIVLRFVPLSASGFRGQPVLADGIVQV